MRALHLEHGQVLRAYATRLSDGDSGRAEDAVQEAFVRVWNRPEVLDNGRGSVRGWLLTTVRNILIDGYRTRRHRPEALYAMVPDAPVRIDEIDRMLSATLLNDALRSVAPAHREAVVGCYYRGLTVAELAGQLGLPIGTVKSRLFYGLRALRAALDERGVDL
ncbi:sigma-70 family RNA polymerase sigma factor [Nakamurella silvestris]|nr:sigma-70 family RNA polymerase sigma factor [Nakamurella silvestris]